MFLRHFKNILTLSWLATRGCEPSREFLEKNKEEVVMRGIFEGISLSQESRFGVFLYGDANNPWLAQAAYDSAGFGTLTPEGMGAVMEMEPDQRDEEAGVCRFKKVSFWFHFPQRSYLEMRDLQDAIASGLARTGGWVSTPGRIGDIRASEFDWEAQDAFGAWLWGQEAPSQETLACLTCGDFNVIISKPGELPDFSEQEKVDIETAGEILAGSVF